MKFRPNVAAIVTRPGGWILIGERGDFAGSWQFPQGGVKPGERHEAALVRELIEEIGLPPEKYRVIEDRGPYRYRFRSGRKKEGYIGQEQRYYLIELLDLDFAFNCGGSPPEFRGVRWIRPIEFRLEWLPRMKRPVYREVMRDFFGLDLGPGE